MLYVVLTAIKKGENVTGKILEMVPTKRGGAERESGVKESSAATATLNVSKLRIVKEFARRSLLEKIMFPATFVMSKYLIIKVNNATSFH